MRRILIIGKDSYIGENLYKWLEKFTNKYCVDIVSPRNNKWKEANFKDVDVVINVAGIAHIMNITEDMRDLFYSVNKDLAIEIAQYAKENGVKHFIHFSSMNVYGDFSGEIIDRDAVNPTGFYGDSKLKGDQGILKLVDDDFKAALVRPPFVYGKGCKGNYNKVRKIAQIIPVFPMYNNKKSMIYIDNLCEFIRLIIDNNSEGIFTPQNKELVSTSCLIYEISKCHKHSIFFTRIFNVFIRLLSRYERHLNRAFADDCYNISLSNHFDFKYNIISFKESIQKTEGR